MPLVAAIEPVRETLGYGQVNLLLFAPDHGRPGRAALARAGPRADPRPTARWLRPACVSGAWAGVGIGLATAIKLTPALFIVYLLVTRQWRAALTAIGTAVGVTAGAFLIAGARVRRPTSASVLWQTERVGAADMTPNQSLAGLLARALRHDRDARRCCGSRSRCWCSRSGSPGPRAAHAEGDELTAFTLVGLTANVISPISWIAPPGLRDPGDHGAGRRGAAPPRPPAGDGPAAGRAGSGIGRAQRGCARRSGSRPDRRCGTPSPRSGSTLLFLISPIWPYEHQLPDASRTTPTGWSACSWRTPWRSR